MNIVEVNTERRMRVHSVGIDMVGDLPLKHILKYAISKSSNMYLLYISLYYYFLSDLIYQCYAKRRVIGVKILPARFAFVQPNGEMG
jgi:hypothetical protein